MGTNTFHLLVAEVDGGRFQILLEERIPVRIGVGGINDGLITQSGLARAIDALIKFKAKVDALNVSHIAAFGTSALRSARNGNDVIATLKEKSGIDTRIISGDEEAMFIYRGVNLALNLGEEKSLIMDIGGGSVEFIIGNGREIFWKQSFDLGAQRLLERFQKHDPILPGEVNEVTRFVDSTLIPLKEAMHTHAPRVLAGSSGTFDTLSDIYCLQQGIAISHAPETPFELTTFDKIHRDIISKNREQRMQIPGMIEMRVDMIVVACCMIKYILDQFQFDRIRVSSYSLKEGALATLLK